MHFFLGNRMRKAWSFLLLISMIFSIVIPFGVTTAYAANETQYSDHVVISQKCGLGGSTSDTISHNFIELYNPTDVTVDLDGWRIDYAGGSTGSFYLSGNIPANGYFFIKGAKDYSPGPNMNIEFTDDDTDCDQYEPSLVLGNKDCSLSLYDGEGVLTDGYGEGAATTLTAGKWAIAATSKQSVSVRVNYNDDNTSFVRKGFNSSALPAADLVYQEYLAGNYTPAKNKTIGQTIGVQSEPGDGDDKPEPPIPGSTNDYGGGDHVLITQVAGLGNAISDTISHNFLVLYNPTGALVDLTGWHFAYENNGAGNAGDIALTDGAFVSSGGTYFIKGMRDFNDEDISNMNLLFTDGNSDCDQLEPGMVFGNKDCRITLYSQAGTDPANIVDSFGEGNLASLSSGAWAMGATSKQSVCVRVAHEDKASDFKRYQFDKANPAKDDANFNQYVAEGLVPSKAADHLVIGSVYFGTDSVSGCDHSFIEIYNPTNEPIVLTGVYSLQYQSMNAALTPSWQKLDLIGVVPAKHSFLIDCGLTGATTATNPGACTILEGKITFDQVWTGISPHNKGVKVVLMQNQTLLTAANPHNGATYPTYNSGGYPLAGYVDMFGVSGNDSGFPSADGYETQCIPANDPNGQSKQKGFFRSTSFGSRYVDTDDNLRDFIMVDFRMYGAALPRCLADGAFSGDDRTPAYPVAPAEHGIYDSGFSGDFDRISVSINGNSTTQMGFHWYSVDTISAGKLQVIKVSDYSTDADFNNAAVTRTFDSISEAVNNVIGYKANKVTATGLTAGTSYKYRVGDGTKWSAVGSFKTDGGKGSAFSFLYTTDQHAGAADAEAKWVETLTAAMQSNPNAAFLLNTGDMVDAATIPNWGLFFTPKSLMMNIPFVPVVGNHEAKSNPNYLTNHFNIPSLPLSLQGGAIQDGYVYSYEYGDALFMILYTGGSSEHVTAQLDSQIEWMRSTVAASSATWKIVALHKAVYSVANHSTDEDIFGIRDKLVPVFDELGVDLVLQGHDHSYMRSYIMKGNQKVSDLVTGGGATLSGQGALYIDMASAGAELYNQNTNPAANLANFADVIRTGFQMFGSIEVSADKLVFNAYRSSDQSLVDSYTIAKNVTADSGEADQNGTPYDADGNYDVTVPHIVINQIYGGQKLTAGGYDFDDTVPVSHSFCELYNPTDEDINLTGWSLHYGHNGENDDNGQQRGDWAKLELSGIIKAHTSFLIRMMPTGSTEAYLRLNLYDDAQTGKGGVTLTGIGSADQDWNQYAISKGSVFVLIAGNTDLEKGVNPFNNATGKPTVDCYVDMLGIGGNDGFNNEIFAYEGISTGSQSKQKSIRRADFKDTDHNATEDDVPSYGQADTLIIGYNAISAAQIAWARPRAQADGVWAVYLGEVNMQPPMPAPEVTTKLDAVKPNCLTNIVGSNSGTTRLITWQMPDGTATGKVKYGVVANLTNALEANAVLSVNDDGTVKMVATLTNLMPGTTYYYSVAGNGTTYDETVYSFKTDGGGTFSFIHISDTQGVDESQYRDYWGPAVSKIMEAYPDAAFLLETGDLIDTKNDTDQWRWYFQYAQSVFGNYAFFPVVGNHEQTSNYDADLFRQHFTVPNALVHNDVTPGTVYSFDYGNAHFVILNSECKTDAGIAAVRRWLENDLQNNAQKWTIAAFHRGPFGMGGGKVDTYYMFADILMEYDADLILHGHDHVYMRCYGTVDDMNPTSTGSYSLETGGSGFKQDSTAGYGRYVDMTAVVNNPSYSVITVSKDKIAVETVYVDFNTAKDKNIYPITVNGVSVDFEISKPSVIEPVATLIDAVAGVTDYISIVETAKNSRVWVLSFTVKESYSDGSVKIVPYAIKINANNANVDGSYDLGAYTLIYDIKGNGANIKEFRVVMNKGAVNILNPAA